MKRTEIGGGKSICSAATLGPWKSEFPDGCVVDAYDHSILVVGGHGLAVFRSRFDEWFVVAARIGWPRALAELEEVHEALGPIDEDDERDAATRVRDLVRHCQLCDAGVPVDRELDGKPAHWLSHSRGSAVWLCKRGA